MKNNKKLEWILCVLKNRAQIIFTATFLIIIVILAWLL